MTAQTTLLFTPGPLTTAASTRAAMQRDWGSREPDFIALTRRLRHQLLALAGDPADYTAIPLQGSGTYAVEATLSTLLSARHRLLVMSNGAYAVRIASIAQRLGLAIRVLEHDECDALDPAVLDRVLAEDPQITHVAVVHGETSSGRINLLEPIMHVVASRGCELLVDAMSTFGALPIDLDRSCIAAVIASCNKCLESVPGVAFSIVRVSSLREAGGNSSSLSLDLHAQWRSFEETGQWRFTPPVQVVAAAVEALRLHASEGGIPARRQRYVQRAERLVQAMASFGIDVLLPDGSRGPCIVCFRIPGDLAARFNIVTDYLRCEGIAIYPGKLTVAETFRVGCMGAFCDDDWQRFFGCFEAALLKTGWKQRVHEGVDA
jgi:2-aminoethylphosphonate-pyruvate transaminase